MPEKDSPETLCFGYIAMGVIISLSCLALDFLAFSGIRDGPAYGESPPAQWTVLILGLLAAVTVPPLSVIAGVERMREERRKLFAQREREKARAGCL